MGEDMRDDEFYEDDLHNDLVPDRRPVEMREMHWPFVLTKILVDLGIRPNAISVASVVFSFVGATWLLVSTQQSYHYQLLGLCAFAILIQFRLVANMVDGMVAVESGRLSPEGKLYNELPDRLSDSMALIAAGYAASLLGAGEWAVWVGWLAAVAALFTAYVRVLGGSLGLPYDFSGSFDKQHRMFYLSLAVIGGALQVVMFWPPSILAGALPIIALGGVGTAMHRMVHMGKDLRARTRRSQGLAGVR